MPLTDDTPLWFGKKWKGTPLKDVDRNFWLYLYDRGKLTGELLEWGEEEPPAN